MKVHCNTCGTNFSLDESKLPSQGAWVRCGICGEVFQVLPPGEEETPPPEPQVPDQEPFEGEPEPGAEPDQPPVPGEFPEPPEEPAEDGETIIAEEQAEVDQRAEDSEPEQAQETEPEWTPPKPDPAHGPPRLGSLDLNQVQGAETAKARERADFGLEERPVEAERPPRSPLFKLTFWLIGLLLLAMVTALGAVVVMARLGVGPGVVDQLASLPGMAALVGRDAGMSMPASQPGQPPRMSLVEVKNLLLDNETVGQIFVIQGKVINNHRRPQRSVLVQVTLRDTMGKMIKRASSYAGSVFTSAELKFMSLGVIERRLASDLALDGRPYVAGPGEALPFMIVVANLPKEGLQFTAEVISSEPLADKPVLR
ncbi:MAG: zinc-ribbon domain-containing protein [Desulfarculaceae bacterium]|nr:zinc-ribbon domain-containing protein [Desulfarculaceae bacterium]MCF8071916.1 zinc-ribbon domain-containing protein [Desulfarculaceae bacterium]MCF8103716.1 zinc-ribbon domain-containing protein [Desulfarculaceae bacterium]MCF8114983.1 zinc-ribbon domain-containing protein [Desulfarculaceae bacterium]